MDLAQTMKFSSIQLIAVPNAAESIDFSSNESRWVPILDSFVSLRGTVEATNEIDVKHSVEGIFKSAEQVKGIIG